MNNCYFKIIMTNNISHAKIANACISEEEISRKKDVIRSIIRMDSFLFFSKKCLLDFPHHVQLILSSSLPCCIILWRTISYI